MPPARITTAEAFASLCEGLLPTAPSSTSGARPAPRPAEKPVDRSEVRAEEWIALGYRVHGGWGSFLTLGIRIGLDAMRRFEAGRRDLDVTYFHSLFSPRACVADGLMLSTFATPGQNTLRIVPHRGVPGTLGEALIRHKPSGRSVRYVLPTSALALLNRANEVSEREGFDMVMDAPPEALYWIVPGLSG